ncbi:MAG: CHAT domain-containing protein [Cyanobacteria bacterium J06623_7]
MSKFFQFLSHYLRLPSWLRGYRLVFSQILLVVLGILLTVVPVMAQSQSSSPARLAQQGQQFYAAGQLDRAIETWQAAAVAYDKRGNQQGSRHSYLNVATAQQALGLYDRSCGSLFAAFKLDEVNCDRVIEDAQTIEPQLEINLPITPEAGQKLLPGIAAIERQPDEPDKVWGLLRFGDYLRASGYPRVANQALELSLASANELKDPNQTTAALLSLGNARREIAFQKQNQFSPQTIVLDAVANAKGDVDSALEPYQPALNYYERAAETAPQELDAIKAQLNRLSLLLDIKEYWDKSITDFNDNLELLEISDSDFLQNIAAGSLSLKQDLQQQLQPQIAAAIATIEPKVANLTATRGGIYGRINLAQSLTRAEQDEMTTAQMLATAIAQAQEINNPTAEAEAMGYLGSLYLRQEQYQSARRLTEGALQLAPTAEHPEIAYRWNAQLGKVLAAQNNREQALAAYETSFGTIRSLRSDLATTPVEPIFREYISLLLAESPTTEQLIKARDVLESLQIATLDNFFRDPCSEISEEPVAIDDVDGSAAVIYPILLEDRLEVILTLPGQPLRHYTTANLTQDKVDNTIQQLRRRALTNPGFAEAIRGARGNPEAETEIEELQLSQEQSLQEDILPLASELYSWLVEPAEADLTASKVKTLVFVLDGSLRNIPMALLYDRAADKYLIEKDYNIALSSGLQLTSPQPLQRQPIKVLAAGVTRDFPAYRFPPIPKVEDELNQIKSIFGQSEILLNNEFTETSLEQKLQESDFPVVHLATHGQFGSTADQTFILSGANEGDPLINVNRFDNLLRAGSLKRSQPIELLVLSACNTAQGDNEAILGLAGVAVRAGARSTLATLWSADDEATANLMGKFYTNLSQDVSISKAKALRQAQLDLLAEADSQYRHPFYWAPFVLVGNWL